MDFKELIKIYSSNNINGQYSFSQESYMNINGEEKLLEINGTISNNISSLIIHHNGQVIFNEKSNNPIEIANKLKNNLGYKESNTNLQESQRQSKLDGYQPFSNNINKNTQKIEINKRQSNKPKIKSI